MFYRYVALEDYENGFKSYQNALRIDSRHYNAWYGIGMIYLRQEKFEFSEHHFRMGHQINPFSSVIMSYLGTALHALKVRSQVFPLVQFNCRFGKKIKNMLLSVFQEKLKKEFNFAHLLIFVVND